MNDKSVDDPLVDDIKEALNRCSEQLDPASLDRLNQIRRKALDQQKTSSKVRKPLLWVPAGGVATAAIVAMLWYEPQQPVINQGLEDFELLTSETELEMLDDMEFVAWMMLEDPSNAG